MLSAPTTRLGWSGMSTFIWSMQGGQRGVSWTIEGKDSPEKGGRVSTSRRNSRETSLREGIEIGVPEIPRRPGPVERIAADTRSTRMTAIDLGSGRDWDVVCMLLRLSLFLDER